MRYRDCLPSSIPTARDPQIIQFPLPVISGSAALPSTVELLADSQRQSLSVGSGPFDVAVQPTMSGTGQVTMTIRDVAGNTRQISRSFYASTALLRPGLSDFMVEAGALRRHYGTQGNAYGPLFAAAALRHGISSALSMAGRVELGAHTQMAGIGGTMVVSPVGEVGLFAAVSNHAGHTGRFVRAQAQRVTRGYTFTASYEATDRNFRQMGDGPREPGGRRELALAGSVVLGRLGSLSASVAQLKEAVGSPAERHFAIGSTSFSANLMGGYVSTGVQYRASTASGLRNRNLGVFGSYTIPLGPRTHAALDAYPGRVAATFERRVPDASGLGYRALLGLERGQPWLEGSIAGRTAAGDLRFDVTRRGGLTGVQVNARGALLRVGSTLLATPRLDYAFALIDVASDTSVTVTVENRPSARSAGRNRRVIVTGLQPYAPNHIGIDPSDVPIETALETAEQVVIPGWRQAAAVTFGDAGHDGARLRMVDPSGAPLSAGAAASWDGGSGLVGYGGEVWIESYRPSGTIEVSTGRGFCRAVLPRLTAAERMSSIRPLLCSPYLREETVF